MLSKIAILLGLLLTLISIPNSAHCMSYPDIEYLVDNKCNCQMEWYDIDIVDLGNYPWQYSKYYENHDSILAKHNSTPAKDSILVLLNDVLKSSEIENLKKSDLIPDNIWLKGEYTYSNATDFILLRYGITSSIDDVYYPDFYFGYISSLGKYYLLSNLDKNAFLSNFNQMVLESGCFNELSPLCIAKLFLRLQYPKDLVLYVSSPEEAVLGDAFLGTESLSLPDYYFYYLSQLPLYYVDIIDNPFICKKYEDFNNDSNFAQPILAEILKCIRENKIEWGIDYNIASNGNIYVGLTSLNIKTSLHSIYIKNDTITRWQVIFNSHNEIKSYTIIEGPFKYRLSMPFGFRHFYYDKSFGH